MRKNLMMLLILCSCAQYKSAEKFKPTFRILPDESGKNMACMDAEDTKKLFRVLNQCHRE